jgi:hypothetical protein
LVERGLTHLQYVDDTMICLETDEDSIFNTKFLLYYFENMSRLKINYHKSEVMVMGVPAKESARIARLLNYKEGTLPMIACLIGLLGFDVFQSIIEAVLC